MYMKTDNSLLSYACVSATLFWQYPSSSSMGHHFLDIAILHRGRQVTHVNSAKHCKKFANSNEKIATCVCINACKHDFKFGLNEWNMIVCPVNRQQRQQRHHHTIFKCIKQNKCEYAAICVDVPYHHPLNGLNLAQFILSLDAIRMEYSEGW